MARFGQLLLQKGAFHGQQIVPAAVVAETERGGDQAAFARGPAASPGNQGWSYHQQWWMPPQLFHRKLGRGIDSLHPSASAQRAV